MRQFSVKTTCMVVLAFCVVPAHRVHPHWLAVILHTINKLSCNNLVWRRHAWSSSYSASSQPTVSTHTGSLSSYTYSKQVVKRQFSVKTTCMVVFAFCVVPAHRVHPHWLAVILNTVNKLSCDNLVWRRHAWSSSHSASSQPTVPTHTGSLSS